MEISDTSIIRSPTTYQTTYQSNNVPVVGDLDVEYKLTPSGNIRLKGFNHYNYRNYYSIAPELTQGIGILFRKDFNHLRDLLGRKKEESETPNR